MIRWQSKDGSRSDMRKPKFDQQTLLLIQRDYEEGKLGLEDIGTRYGCSGALVCKYARQHEWRRRRQTTEAQKRAMAAPKPRKPATKVIAQRLCKVINRKLDQMEKDMASGALSSADLERDAKTVASMIGGMQKVVQVPGEDKVMKPDDANAGAGNAVEVERLQREIIERFEQIERRRVSERGSG
ncbi:hypothetical protein [Hyphomicrobium sp. D-2]|uniref:hypothetical protein n=1 Tax=Hyphomicrobium sp. D-2 TaxID=3041621 RepID=UPI002457FCAB|nr:hypothetical protein [Hyphomicrobium sp. D-2]MDH4981292.1 hypothetical protein [Hyphomicrobium sp. D-2]